MDLEFKGTKGNWRVSEVHESIIDEKGYGIAQINGITNEKDWIANAKLISAAPDLLELCLLVYNSFDGGNVITFSENDIEQFKTTIEKALK